MQRSVAHMDIQQESLLPTGQVFRIRSGIHTRSAVVLATAADQAEVLFGAGRHKTVPISKLTELDNDITPSGTFHTAAWQLIELADSPAALEYEWESDMLVGAALASASSTPNQMRLFALDCVNGDRPDLLQRLDLAPQELVIALASCHLHSGQPDRAADVLVGLAPDTHPLVPDLLLAMWPTVSERSASSTLSELLYPLVDTDPLAEALLVLLRRDRHLELSLPAARALHAALHGMSSDSYGHLGTLLGMAEGGRVTTDVSSYGPAASIYAALMFAQDPNPELPPGQLDIAELAHAEVAVIDDIIDSGAVGAELRELQLNVDPTYLTARTAPDALTDRELMELDYTAEAARRAFLSRDREALERAAGSTPQAVAVLLLDDLRNGRPLSADEIQLLPSPDRAQARALSAAISQGKGSEDLLKDRSLWPALLHLAVPSSESPAAKDFQSWAHLHRATQALLEWDWHQALDEASSALRSAQTGRIRREAHNLLACAYYLLGDDDSALTLFERSVAEQFLPANLDNMIAVASDATEERILAVLTRLAKDAPTPELKAEAAVRGIRLWLTRPDAVTTEPPVLRQIARSVLELDVPNAQMRQLLELQAVWDAPWLGGTSTRTWARQRSSDVAIVQAQCRSLSDYVGVLTRALAEDPDDRWLQGRRRKLVLDLHQQCLDRPGLETASDVMVLLDSQMPLNLTSRVHLTAAAVGAAVTTLGGRHRLNRSVVDALLSLHRDVTTSAETGRDKLLLITQTTIDDLAMTVASTVLEQLDASVEKTDGRKLRLSRLGTADVDAFLNPAHLTDSINQLEMLVPYVRGPVKEALTASLGRLARARQVLQQEPDQ